MTKTKSPERSVLRRGDLRVARVMIFQRWTIWREMCCVRELDARESTNVLKNAFIMNGSAWGDDQVMYLRIARYLVGQGDVGVDMHDGCHDN